MAAKINKWIEENKFWAESIRTVIFSFVGTLIAIFVIKYIESKMDYSWDKKKARLNTQLAAMNSFSESSYEFTSLSVRWRENKIDSLELRDKYDYFRKTYHTLKLNCSSLDSSINETGEALSNKMMLLINNKAKLVSVKEDKSDSYEKIRREIKNETDTIVFRLNIAIDKED
jgi:predicted HNH restriction endonuclease